MCVCSNGLNLCFFTRTYYFPCFASTAFIQKITRELPSLPPLFHGASLTPSRPFLFSPHLIHQCRRFLPLPQREREREREREGKIQASLLLLKKYTRGGQKCVLQSSKCAGFLSNQNPVPSNLSKGNSFFDTPCSTHSIQPEERTPSVSSSSSHGQSSGESRRKGRERKTTNIGPPLKGGKRRRRPASEREESLQQIRLNKQTDV